MKCQRLLPVDIYIYLAFFGIMESPALKHTLINAFFEDNFDLLINLTQFDFLGHLSHSGDLLLWVGVRRRASCDVRRALTSSPQKLLGQS